MDLCRLTATVMAVNVALCIGLNASGEPGITGEWAGRTLMNRTAGDIPKPPSIEIVKQSYITQPGIRKSIMQTPLQIKDTKYERGIGTYAASEIIVRLPKPGRTFQAEIGIDNNIQTQGKLGSAIFVIEANGKELFKSEIMKASDAPIPVKIDLNGTTEFTLKTLDAGDGPEYDETNWADASVTLDDKHKIWLDESAVLLKSAQFSEGIPFSFTYNGKQSSELLPKWDKKTKKTDLKDGRTRAAVTYTDPETGLQVECESTVFNNYPASDWVVYFRNTGTLDTPLIENIRAMDMQVTPQPGSDIIFHHSHGSTATGTDFLPIDEVLAPDAEIKLAPVNGRSSDTTLPFFNLEWSGGGVVGAIGWSGQWSMSAKRDKAGTVDLQAGQQTTHLKLHPGEVIRTPRMLLLAWRGADHITGHNRFRQLILDYYTPKVNGEIPMPPVTENSWFYVTANGSNEANQLDLINAASKIGVEYYWLDAGWFEDGGWSQGAGSWSPNKEAFPRGLKPLSDAAHKQGMKFVLWFEPERVCPGTQIDREHPEWVMRVHPDDVMKTIQNLDDNKLFNLGNPDARKWLTDMLSKRISEWDVDIYRQDFNIFGSTYFWQAADAPDRQGMAENMYIQGLYTMWDDLIKQHPGLVIDNCASGGRRIDLELISRSIALWRSDSQCAGKPMPVQDQVQTAGLSLYVPLHSASVWSFDPYEWRSVATSGTNLCMDYRTPDFDKAGAKRAIKEVKELRKFWTGDYYPLVGINTDEAQWCAWQFDRPDLGEGFAMYFRRPKCRYMALESGLQGLDPDATYDVTFVDTKTKKTMSGKELAVMPVTVRTVPGSALIRYKKR
ncbi:MAG: alpha-galactosidase [Armatimonadota bacterium]